MKIFCIVECIIFQEMINKKNLLLVIHSFDSSISFGVSCESHKTESTTAIGITILDDDLNGTLHYATQSVIHPAKWIIIVFW